ncbi:MAG: efflux RND transporter permease subunit [Verrucomicrobia bacterium]|nr:efflux RND transporter permease subunit [Verrucomicrobiota bacterium]
MNFSHPFIRRPVMTILLMLALFAIGAAGLHKLPISDMPNVDYPSLFVTADLPGASPEVMAKDITTPLEKELMGIKGIEHLFSSSWTGGCYVWIQFNLDKSIDLAAQEVQRAIDRASLPKDLPERPKYHRRSLSNTTIFYAVLSSPSMSPEKLYDYAEAHIQKPLAMIEGVGEVKLSGKSPALEVEIEPELLAARDLTMEDVKRAIQRGGARAPVGSLTGDFRRLGLDLPQSIQKKSDLENLAIVYRRGAPVRLKDLGSIKEQGLQNDRFHFVDRHKSEAGLLIEIRKESGANVVALSEKVDEELKRIRSELPPTCQLKVILDQSIWIKESIHDLQANLGLALLLVAAVIYFFLGRVKDTLIPCLALPLSLLGTCAAIHFLGYSLDILSLLALTLAMGFVVDDAIVVLENIARLREQGATTLDAAILGSKQICFTVLSMTLSLIAVFIPLIFLGGVVGNLFREFSMALSIAILISGLVSLTLIPMLCARIRSSLPQKKEGKLQAAMLRFYKPSLRWCLNHRKITLFGGILSLALSVWIFTKLPVQLLPKEDLGWGVLSIHVPDNDSESDVEKEQKKAEAIIAQNSSVECFATWINGHRIYAFMRMVPLEKRPPLDQILEPLRRQIEETPGLSVWAGSRGLISLSLGDTGGETGYKYSIRSLDVIELHRSVRQMETAMNQRPEFEKVSHDLPALAPKLSIQIAKEKADLLGLSPESIQSALQSAYTSSIPARIERSGERIPIYLSLKPQYRKDPASLEKLSLKSAQGTMIPLKAVASWKEELSPPSIQHLFQLPVATLNFKLSSKTTPEQAAKTLETLAEEILPSQVRGSLAGDGEVQKSALGDMKFLFILSILAMYVVLGILYESFIHPITILSSLPFAGLGAGLTLLLFREPLSLYSFVGLILLIGIVKKNGIMLVDHAIQSEEKDAERAIFDACLVRFRPIMMTTMAALMGAVPVAIGLGAGGGTRKGLGLAICGGLLFSQLLTLYLTPVVYLILERLKRPFNS